MLPPPATATPAGPTITIEPADSWADEPIHIRVTGLEPSQQITIAATLNDDQLQPWASSAVFAADAAGTVDLMAQEPLSGSYRGVDAMGLFWSMTPVDVSGDPPYFANSDTSAIELTFSVLDEGLGEIAQISTKRIRQPDTVWRQEVTEAGLVGFFYAPEGAGPYPGLLILGGSGGGIDEDKAALLAGHGYAALALAYFGHETLPEELKEIPLEYFAAALEWLAVQAQVDGERLGVIGTSRGGELALLLGATYPEIKAVVGYVPSGVVFGNFGRSGIGTTSAWSWGGTPVPYAPAEYYFSPEELPSDEEVAATTIIPVERINGPVLLISGRNDRVWPSTLLADIAFDRLAEHEHPYPYEHLRYDGAGHAIGAPYWPATTITIVEPVTGQRLSMGGSPRANARASADAWSKLLDFLAQSLSSGR